MDFTPALNESSNQIDNLQNLPDDCHDKESFKGAFGWVRIFQKYMVPFIVRVINGERIVFVSVQMVGKNENIQKYFNFFRPDILRCAIVKFQCMTHTEAKLFNEINMLHCDNHYRKFSTNECIIRNEDLSEFYEFTRFCYETLYHNTIPNEKYGFIQIDSFPVIPYIIIDSIKYTALSYFETNGNILQTIKITDWNFSYLKFCKRILGNVETLYSSDSCDVISIDYIKSKFLPESSFKEFKLDYTKYILPLINNEPANALLNDRIEQRPEIVPATENTTPHTSTKPVISHSKTVITNGQEMIANQMGSLEKNQAGNSKKNSTLGHRQLPSPPPALPIYKTGSLEKNQAGNSKKNSTLGHRQLPSPPPALPIYKTRLSEIQQGSNAINSLVKSSQLPSPSPSTSTALSRLGTRKISSIKSEIIDLTSVPSSPAPNSQQATSYHINTAMQSKRKFEKILHETSQTSGCKGSLEKNQAGNSKKNSTLGHRQLPSPPPALPIYKTGSLEKNQAGNSKKNSTLGHRQLPSPPPALPIYKTRLSEIQQGSNAINSLVKSSQLPSPSPSTSTALSRLGTRKISSIKSEIIDLTSVPSSPAPNSQQATSYHINTAMQSKRKFEKILHETSQTSGCKGSLEKNQAGNSKKNSTLGHRQLPSPPPALPIYKTGSLEKNQAGNSKKNSTLGHRQLPSPPPALPIYKTRLSEIQQGSNAINSLVKSSQLPSPSPSTSTALSRLGTRKISSIKSEIIDLTSVPSSPAPNSQQATSYHINTAMQSKRKFEKILHETSQTSGCKGSLEKNQAGNSKKNSTLGHRQLPSPPPALPIYKTGSLEKNQAGNSKINSTLGHRQLPSPPPALPIYKTRLSEIQQGSNAIDSLVKSSQLPSPSPSTSTALSRLGTRKISSIKSEIIDLASVPSSPAPNSQQATSYHINTAMQSKRKFEKILHETSQTSGCKGSLEKNQAGNSKKNSTLGHRQLPSPPPALPIYKTGSLEKNQAGNSKKNSTLGHRQLPYPPPALPIYKTRLSEIQQGSNAINSLVKSSQLPSPSPSTSTALSRLGTRKISSIKSEIIDLTSVPSSPAPNSQQATSYHINTAMQSKRKFEKILHETSQTIGCKGSLEKNQAGNSKKNSTLGHRQLPSPPPALPIYKTGLLEQNQAGNSKKNSTLGHRQLPSPPPALPIFETRINSRIVSALGLSEILRGSSKMQDTVNIPQLPSPPTSTALSIINTERNRRIVSEMIDLTSPPSSPTPNNQSSRTFSTQLEIVYRPMELDDEFEEIIYVTSRNDTYIVNIVYNCKTD